MKTGYPPSLPAAPEAPWHAGLRAARANLVPGLIVQGLMVATVLTYYLVPSSAGFFDSLAGWKARYGFGYSAFSAVIAGAIVPELLRIVVFQRGRPSRRNLGNLAFAGVFWGISGMQVDLFYRLQALWFGTGTDILTITKKVLVDQFLYCPLLAAPQATILYHWRAGGYSLQSLRQGFTPTFYSGAVLPTLVANWGVWFPVVAALYSLPGLLQIPLFSLALSLWVMLFTWMSERRNPPPS